jgi:hypothetical protein
MDETKAKVIALCTLFAVAGVVLVMAILADAGVFN